MNNKLIAGIITLCILSFVHGRNACAQTGPDSSWKPIYLTVGGGNTINGVQAQFQLNKCNDEDVVFVKFTNYNKQSAKIEWYDAVFTMEKKWIRKENPSEKKSLSIPSGSEITGDCSGKNVLVVVKLNTFISSFAMFSRYATTQLSISFE